MAKAEPLEGEGGAAAEGAGGEGGAEEDPLCPTSWPPREWSVGMKVDAKDKHGGWYEAKVLKVEETRVRVHFRGWGREDGKSRFDEWANKDDLEKMAAYQTRSAAKAKPEESDDEPDDGSYDVNAILRSRTTDGETEFRVSWLGRDKSENEWVVESRLRDPEDLNVADKVDKFVAAAEKRAAKKAETEAAKSASASASSAEVDYAKVMSQDQHDQFTTLLSLTGTETAQGKADAYQALKDTFWDVTTAFDKLSRKRSANAPQRLDVTVNGDHQEDEDPESDDDELTADESELEEDEETDDSSSDDDGEEDDEDAPGDEDDDEDDDDESGDEEEEEELVQEPVPEGWQPETWTVGYMCDALDGFKEWFQAKVIEVEDNQRVKIHFQGWPSRWDEWMPVTSDRLAPHKFRSNKDAKAARKKFKAEQEAKKEAKAATKAAEKAKEAKRLKAKLARDKKRAKSQKASASAKAKLKVKQDRARAREEKRLAKEEKKRDRERLRDEKKQAKKDKGPKRPISAYFYFMQENREKVKAENLESTFGEQTKMLAQQWNEMETDARTKYVELAAKDKARYDEEKAAWDDAHPVTVKKSTKKKPRAPNAFNLYMSAQLAKVKAAQPELSHKDAFAQVGADWKSLPSDELAKWKEIEAIARAKFAEEHKNENDGEDQETGGDDEEEETAEERKARKRQAKLEAKDRKRQERAEAKKKKKKGMRAAMEDIADDDDDDDLSLGATKKYVNPKKRWKEAAASEEAEAAKRKEKEHHEELEREREAAEKKAKDEKVARKKTEKLRVKYLKQLNETSSEVIGLMYLKRTTLLMWLDAPDFAERVTGCMVRICEPDNHRRSYEMGIVTGVFDFRSAYQVDWAATCKGLLVTRAKTKGVLRLEALSNLDCELDEVAALLASLQKPEDAASGGPTPMDKMMMRYKKQEKGCYTETINEHLHKLKNQSDKFNSMGDRKKMAEMIEKRQMLLDLSKTEPVDYSAIRKSFPELKPVPGKFHIKDEFIWEQILTTMKTTDKLVPTEAERSPRSASAAGTSKRKRESDEESYRGKRGREDRRDDPKDRRDRDRERERERERKRDRERERERGRDRGRDRFSPRDDRRESVWDRRDDKPLKKAKNFVVDTGHRGAAPSSVADQGYSRNRAPSINTDAGYSRQAWSSERSPMSAGRDRDRGLGGQRSPAGGGGPPSMTDQGYRRDGPSTGAGGWGAEASGAPSIESLMQQAKDGAMSPRALLQNADKLAKQLEAQLERQTGDGGDGGGGGGGGGGGFDRPPPADIQPSEEHFPVPMQLAGAVIGKGGQTVQDIQNRTGARLQMAKEPDHNGNRMVQLTGAPHQVKSAKEMIIKLVHDEKMRSSKPGHGSSVEVIVPDSSVGLILGKGGETIKQITARTGCHISLDDAPRGTPQRVMRLKGKEHQIGAARNEILELVRSGQQGGNGGPRAGPMGGGPPMGGHAGMHPTSPAPQQQQVPPSADTSKSSGTSSGWGGADDGSIDAEVEVPDKYAGLVIGKGGNTVKDIMQQTGCKVQMSQRDEASKSGVRRCTFRGTSAQVTAAKILVNEIITGAETGTPGYVGPDARKYLPGAAPIKGGGIETTIVDHIVKPPTAPRPIQSGAGMPPGIPVPQHGGGQVPPGAIPTLHQGGPPPGTGHHQGPPPGTGMMASVPPSMAATGGWGNPPPGPTVGGGPPPGVGGAPPLGVGGTAPPPGVVRGALPPGVGTSAAAAAPTPAAAAPPATADAPAPDASDFSKLASSFLGSLAANLKPQGA